MHAADSLFTEGRGFGSQLANLLETNIWSLLIPLDPGAAEAKAVKNARRPGNAAARRPLGPPRIQLFPGNSDPSPRPRQAQTDAGVDVRVKQQSSNLQFG